MRSATPLALAALLAAAGCAQREWVRIKPEPEAYPLESARKICDHYAEGRATSKSAGAMGWPSDRGSNVDPARYQRLFTICMEHYGWVQQTKSPSSAPQSQDGS